MTFSIESDVWFPQAAPRQDAANRSDASDGRGKEFASSLAGAAAGEMAGTDLPVLALTPNGGVDLPDGRFVFLADNNLQTLLVSAPVANNLDLKSEPAPAEDVSDLASAALGIPAPSLTAPTGLSEPLPENAVKLTWPEQANAITPPASPVAQSFAKIDDLQEAPSEVPRTDAALVGESMPQEADLFPTTENQQSQAQEIEEATSLTGPLAAAAPPPPSDSVATAGSQQAFPMKDGDKGAPQEITTPALPTNETTPIQHLSAGIAPTAEIDQSAPAAPVPLVPAAVKVTVAKAPATPPSQSVSQSKPLSTVSTIQDKLPIDGRDMELGANPLGDYAGATLSPGIFTAQQDATSVANDTNLSSWASLSVGQPASSGYTASPAPALPQVNAVIVAAPSHLPEIVARATSEGQDDRLVVQLDPPELGRISIDFKFDAQGLQHVTITAESPEAMRQLRLMHFELVQALERNGLSSQNMSFQQQNQQQHEGWGQQLKLNDQRPDGNVAALSRTVVSTDIQAIRQSNLNGRLDLRL